MGHDRLYGAVLGYAIGVFIVWIMWLCGWYDREAPPNKGEGE